MAIVIALPGYAVRYYCVATAVISRGFCCVNFKLKRTRKVRLMDSGFLQYWKIFIFFLFSVSLVYRRFLKCTGGFAPGTYSQQSTLII